MRRGALFQAFGGDPLRSSARPSAGAPLAPDGRRRVGDSSLLLAIAGLVLALLASTCKKRNHVAPATPVQADAIVVGAGIAGLSAAWELSRAGAHVLVVDMASIPGGHAVMATGDLCIVGTPFQEERGFHDTPEIATSDFLSWGEDANPDWVGTYVNTSRHDIYDWLTAMGVTFETLVNPAGNSVQRTHRTKGRGLGLVTAVYTACATQTNVAFVWNTRVDQLVTVSDKVAGIRATNVRSGEPFKADARVVILSTGGFQSNLDMVRANWPQGLRYPSRLLVGSGINSVGLGHGLAKAAGAALTRLDHQWNYITGIPDPRYADGQRGLNAYNVDSIWVNAEGKRFIAERSSTKFGLPILVRQTGGTYWSVFDQPAKKSFWVAGSDWADFAVIDKLIFGNAQLVKTASTLDELATMTGLPAPALHETIERYNRLVDRGIDEDFSRFGPGKPYRPKRIESPPYYAVQFFPLTRKSMGGVAIDTSCRALDSSGRIVPGLYAAGELTGLAGVNGKAGLEGTFLGPSIVTGRVAGRAALGELGLKPTTTNGAPNPAFLSPPVDPGARTEQCLKCHDLPSLVTQARPGYWHFERAHTKVIAEKYECTLCHAELSATYTPAGHRIDHAAQIRVCPICHKGEDR